MATAYPGTRVFLRVFTNWSGDQSYWLDPPFELGEDGEFTASAIGEETKDMKPVATMMDLQMTVEHYEQFLNDPEWGEGAIVFSRMVELQGESIPPSKEIIDVR